MAHKIATNVKTGEGSYVGAEPAWHGLGVVLNRPFTASEAIEQGGLDFNVVKTPTFFKVGRKQFQCEGKYAVIRTDNKAYLGTVGEAYEPLQNRDAFAFFDALVEKDEAIYHTAGALGEGEKIWILAKMPDYIRIAGSDDKIEQYVLLYNSHNGSSGVVACVTPVRVVCNNTLTAAIHGTKHRVSIRHTANATERLKQATELLGISNQYAKEMEQIFNIMASKKVNSKMVEGYLDSIYPLNPENEARHGGVKIREAILEDFEDGVGQDMVTTKGTVFGLYNAVTHFLDHTKEYKDGNAKMKSIFFAGGKRIRQKAFDSALVLVE